MWLCSLEHSAALSTLLLKLLSQEGFRQEGKPAKAGLETQPTRACVDVLTAEGGSGPTKRNRIFTSLQFFIPLLRVASQISGLFAEGWWWQLLRNRPLAHFHCLISQSPSTVLFELPGACCWVT